MFGRVIWDKLPECIFENFEIVIVLLVFSKIARVIYLKKHPNQTCDYWLITPNQITLVLKLIFFNSGQLQIIERVITKQRAITK